MAFSFLAIFPLFFKTTVLLEMVISVLGSGIVKLVLL